MRECPGALEADLDRYYGLDLGDLYRRRVTPRYVAVRAANLPPGAGVWTALRADAAWTTTDHLVAKAVDVLNVANWQRTKDGADGRGAPEPIPRPSQIAELEAKSERAVVMARRFKDRQRQRQQAEGG